MNAQDLVEIVIEYVDDTLGCAVASTKDTDLTEHGWDDIDQEIFFNYEFFDDIEDEVWLADSVKTVKELVLLLAPSFDVSAESVEALYSAPEGQSLLDLGPADSELNKEI